MILTSNYMDRTAKNMKPQNKDSKLPKKMIHHHEYMRYWKRLWIPQWHQNYYISLTALQIQKDWKTREETNKPRNPQNHHITVQNWPSRKQKNLKIRDPDYKPYSKKQRKENDAPQEQISSKQLRQSWRHPTTSSKYLEAIKAELQDSDNE